MLQVFQLFRTYVANVFSRCYKSRFGVTHVAVDPIMHVGVEGARAAGADRDRAGVGRGLHGTRSGHEIRSGTGPHVKEYDAGVRTLAPVRALAFPLIIR